MRFMDICKGSKVLLQYSGGKDSTACLIYLLKKGCQVTAIHFTHQYSYRVPINEARRICNCFNVNLEIVDITKQLKKLLLHDFRLRPCRFCKAIMDAMTVSYAQKNGFNIICVGDTKSDTTLVARIDKGDKSSLLFSRYFNQNVELPQHMIIYRPLICMSSDEVIAFLSKNSIVVERVQDTGDKYFEYSREGCPLQFKDFGVLYTEELMGKLEAYNEVCSEFARLHGIRASVHLPSGFIVTIPKGYEEECRKYLITKNCLVGKNERNYSKATKLIIFTVAIYKELEDQRIMSIALQRLMERIGLPDSQLTVAHGFYCLEKNAERLIVSVDSGREMIYGLLAMNKIIKSTFLKNVLLEIFHTYDYTVQLFGTGNLIEGEDD